LDADGAHRNDHIDVQADQVGGEFGHPVDLSARKSQLRCDVAALS
jgi:hypothetical protein